MIQVMLKNRIPSRARSWKGLGSTSIIFGTFSYKLNDFISCIPTLSAETTNSKGTEGLIGRVNGLLLHPSTVWKSDISVWGFPSAILFLFLATSTMQGLTQPWRGTKDELICFHTSIHFCLQQDKKAATDQYSLNLDLIGFFCFSPDSTSSDLCLSGLMSTKRKIEL